MLEAIIIRQQKTLDVKTLSADKWLELTEKTFDFASNAKERFEKGDAKTRRDIFTSLGNGFYLKDKQLIIEPCEWLVPIQEKYPELERAFKEVRTKKFGSLKEKIAALSAIQSSWLRRLDSNQ